MAWYYWLNHRCLEEEKNVVLALSIPSSDERSKIILFMQFLLLLLFQVSSRTRTTAGAKTGQTRLWRREQRIHNQRGDLIMNNIPNSFFHLYTYQAFSQFFFWYWRMSTAEWMVKSVVGFTLRGLSCHIGWAVEKDLPTITSYLRRLTKLRYR